jgi:hypothetical protein
MIKVNKDRSKITRTSGKEVYANVAIPTHGCNNIVKQEATNFLRIRSASYVADTTQSHLQKWFERLYYVIITQYNLLLAHNIFVHTLRVITVYQTQRF